ncbi:MAG: helix-turn-helix domain-containing protein, partial [Pseudomonadota bacterium]
MTASRNKRDTATLRRELYDDVAAGRLYLHEAAKRMRAVLGLNQRQFARMLGIAERTYIDFERQAGNPTLETLRRIGCAFGFEVKFGPMQTLHDEGEQARTRCTEVKKPT